MNPYMVYEPSALLGFILSSRLEVVTTIGSEAVVSDAPSTAPITKVRSPVDCYANELGHDMLLTEFA